MLAAGRLYFFDELNIFLASRAPFQVSFAIRPTTAACSSNTFKTHGIGFTAASEGELRLRLLMIAGILLPSFTPPLHDGLSSRFHEYMHIRFRFFEPKFCLLVIQIVLLSRKSNISYIACTTLISSFASLTSAAEGSSNKRT